MRPASWGAPVGSGCGFVDPEATETFGVPAPVGAPSSAPVDPEPRAADTFGVSGPIGADAGFEAFLHHTDALTQHRVAVVAHVYRANPYSVFVRHRAEVWRTWDLMVDRDDEERDATAARLLVRAARALAAGRGDEDPARRSPDAADDTDPELEAACALVRHQPPGWAHPDPWALLAPDAMRPLRALAHLDPRSRDVAVLRWLGVPGDEAGAELGLEPAAYRAARDHAMRFWAHLVHGAPR